MRPRMIFFCIIFFAASAAAQNVERQAPSFRRVERFANSRATRLVQQYRQQHNFPIRVIETGPANRRVARVFVPVTPQTWNSFFKRFNEANGFAALRHTKDRMSHVAPNLRVDANGAPQDCYLWGLNYNQGQQFNNGHGRGDYRHLYMDPTHLGWIAAVDLEGAPLNHLRTWLESNERTGNRVGSNNCMLWLSDAPTGEGEGKYLFGELGIRRSRAGAQIVAKMVHGSNNRLEVFGITVPNIETFNQMTDEQIVGPEPQGGVTSAVKL
ncbi:MAG: hypothetical protein V1754_01170 [Pseudomonadota bacterium]